MSASQVHAVMAAGLNNPTLLARWRQRPELLRKSGVDPEAIDLDALWKFAGLSVKVRHNGLRGDLPATFRLLNVAGLEIEVFASYAAFKADGGKEYGATPEARSHDLAEFLKHWLDFQKREHILLWDLLRHEMTLARLRKACLSTGETIEKLPKNKRPARAQSVPRIGGEIVLHEMRCDPGIIERVLRQKRPNLNKVVLGTFHFGYWRTPQDVFILQLDELGFYLLSMIDGKRSASDISQLINGRRTANRSLLKALSDLAGIGIVAFG